MRDVEDYNCVVFFLNSLNLNQTFSIACALLFSTFCIHAKSPTSDSKAKNLLHISLKFG